MNRSNETPEVRYLLNRLERIRPTGNGWDARCPAHEDDDPSLSVSVGDGGQVLIYCHAGCSPEAILDKLGLRWADLWPENAKTAPQRPKRKIGETSYESRGLDQVHYATHRRIDYSDKSKKIWWERPDGTRGLGDLTQDDLPLYRTHLLAFSRPAVFIVEGEKAADALATLGVEVVATFGANHKPSDEALRPLLAYPTIVIWPDHDPPGQAHGSHLATRFTALGHEHIQIIDWPDAGPKDDAHDFVAAGGNRQQLAELVKNAPQWCESVASCGGEDYLVNGLAFTCENIDLRDGIKATVVVRNGAAHPIVVERGNLDSAKFREKLAETTNLDDTEIMRFREHVRQCAINPTANQPHTSLQSLRDQSIEHGQRSRDEYIQTGLTKLDERIGGFLPGQLIAVSGLTGGGKTAMMNAISAAGSSR